MNQSILWWRPRSAAAQAWHYSAQSHSTSCSGPGYTQTSAGSSLVHWLIRDTGLLLLLLKMHLHCNSFSEVSADSTQGAAQWSTWNNFQLRKAKYFCVTSSNNFTELCVPNISKTLLSLQTALLSLVTVMADIIHWRMEEGDATTNKRQEFAPATTNYTSTITQCVFFRPSILITDDSRWGIKYRVFLTVSNCVVMSAQGWTSDD